MRKKLLFFFLFFVGYYIHLSAQTTPEYTLIAEIKEKTDYIVMDNMEHVYTYDATNIKKYDKIGSFMFSYSALSIGRISSVDVYNPFKIMVFSKDFERLVFLDNKLAIQQSASILSDLNILSACVCVSYDNGFWVYDESKKQLFRYDAQYNLRNTSQMITNFVEKDIDPLFIKETNSGFLLLNDKENGILVFDRFGTYLKSIPIFTDYFYVYNNQIVYIENELLHSIDIQTLQQGKMPLPEEGIQQFCVEKQKIAILTKDNTVKIFKMEMKKND